MAASMTSLLPLGHYVPFTAADKLRPTVILDINMEQIGINHFVPDKQLIYVMVWAISVVTSSLLCKVLVLW